jgi:hypothetical protein
MVKSAPLPLFVMKATQAQLAIFGLISPHLEGATHAE